MYATEHLLVKVTFNCCSDKYSCIALCTWICSQTTELALWLEHLPSKLEIAGSFRDIVNILARPRHKAIALQFWACACRL